MNRAKEEEEEEEENKTWRLRCFSGMPETCPISPCFFTVVEKKRRHEEEAEAMGKRRMALTIAESKAKRN